LGNLFGHGVQKTIDEYTPPNYTMPGNEEGMNIYHHDVYGFSFSFPKNLTVATFKESGGEIVLVQEEKTDKSFQIFILPFDETMTVMTPERIAQDLPDLPVEYPQEAIIGVSESSGARALIFFSTDPTLGRTREVWIIKNRLLYQITTAESYDKWLAEIMKTWRFDF